MSNYFQVLALGWGMNLELVGFTEVMVGTQVLPSESEDRDPPEPVFPGQIYSTTSQGGDVKEGFCLLPTAVCLLNLFWSFYKP